MTQPLVPARPSSLEPAFRALGERAHASFHGTVLRSVVGAGLGALLGEVACLLSGTELSGSRLFMVLAATGAFAGVASRGRRWAAGGLGAVLGALGSVASGLAAQWAPFSAALLGVTAAPVLGEGEPRRRQLLTGIVAGALGYAGLHVAQIILQSGILLALVPGPLAAAAAGATAGLFIGLASAPRYLLEDPDPLEEAFRPALDRRDGEVHELLERSLEIHRTIRTELPLRFGEAGAAGLEARVAEQVMRILRIAEHCRQVQDDLDPEALALIEDRIASLEAKQANTWDQDAQQTYAHAISSLEAQRDGLGGLRAARERVVARLHVNVALLENLRMSFVRLRSADVELLDGESTLGEAIEELGRELDATTAAITEVFPAPALPPRRSRAVEPTFSTL